MNGSLDEIRDRLSAIEATLRERADPGAKVHYSTFWVVDELRRRETPGGEVVFGGVVPDGTGSQIEWQYGLPVSEVLSRPWDERSSAVMALAHPMRLRILELVHGGIDRVAEMADQSATGTTGQIYHHVKLLSDAGWLVPSGRGRLAIPSARIVPLLTLLLILDSPG